jgi:hypothetical protein
LPQVGRKCCIGRGKHCNRHASAGDDPVHVWVDTSKARKATLQADK